MRTIKFEYMKYIISLAAFFIISSSAPGLMNEACAETPNTLGRSSAEVTVYFKNAAKTFDDFIKSSFAEEFVNSRLFTRYSETIAAGKIEQLKKSMNASFASSLVYDKALAFFECPAVFYIINSDLDALSLLLTVERDLSKFEYFAKFKKGIKSEKYLNSNIYSITSDDGIDSLYFCGFNAKTFFSNDIELIRSIVSKKTSVEKDFKYEAPITVNINLEKLNAKVSEIYKRLGSETLFIYPDAAGKKITMAAYNGTVTPDAASINNVLGVMDKIDVPEELSFAASVFSFAASDFFKTALKYAEKFEMPAELKTALKSLSEQPGKGLSLVISGSGNSAVKSPITGVLATCMALGLDKCDSGSVEVLNKYLNGYKIEYNSPVLSVSSAGQSGQGRGELQWAGNFNSINRVDAAYFYYLKYDDNMAAMTENIINASLSVNSWQGSNAYELMNDLKQSQSVIKALDRLLVMRINGCGGLNSVIKIKLR